MTYRLGLYDLKLNLLNEAFLTCLKDRTFPPNIAQIRQAYDLAAERAAKTYFIGLPEVKEGNSDRGLWKNLMAEFWEEHKKQASEAMSGQRWSEDVWKRDEEENKLPRHLWGWRPRMESLKLEARAKIVPGHSTAKAS